MIEGLHATARTMEAAVFRGPGAPRLEQVPVPRVGRDEVLVSITAAGLCGTDLHILSDPAGYPARSGVVLGHELTGAVAWSGADVELATGTRVIVNPNDACGLCDYCRRGRMNLCWQKVAYGIDADGGFAPFWCGPARLVHPIAPDARHEVAALGEPLACALRAVNRAGDVTGRRVAVIGSGATGLLMAQRFAYGGAVGVDVVVRRAERACELQRVFGAWGLPVVPRPRLVDDAEGDKVDVAVDAAGSALPTALRLVDDGGRIVLFGVDANARHEIAQHQVTMRELDVVGAWLAPDTFPQAAELIGSGEIAHIGIVTHEVPLSEIDAAVDTLRSGQAVKVLIIPTS